MAPSILRGVWTAAGALQLLQFDELQFPVSLELQFPILNYNSLCPDSFIKTTNQTASLKYISKEKDTGTLLFVENPIISPFRIRECKCVQF